MAKGEGRLEEASSVTHEGRKTKRQMLRSLLMSNLLLIMMIVAMITGVAVGLGVRFRHPDFRNSKRNLMYLEFPGYMVLRMLKVIIIPLIVSSLIGSLANMPKKAQGRLGGLTILYYILTTFMAVLLGILLVCTIKPGTRALEANNAPKKRFANGVDSFLDLIRNFVPPNIIEATFRQSRTLLGSQLRNKTINGTTDLVEETDTSLFKVEMVNGTDTLGLIVFSIALGVIISQMGARGRPLGIFFEAFSEAVINLVKAIMWLVPFGIVFLVAHKILLTKNLKQEFESLGWYIGTVLLGLAIHGFVVLPGIYAIFRRQNPFKFMFSMSKALVTALATASSSATLPITLRCLEDNAGISPTISRFVLPIGATVNMDGTALYEAVASIYIAQMDGIYLGASEVVIVSLTATAAAIGAAGVPEAGLVTMLIVLQALGLPSDRIGAILAVDWFLDRCRTCINVWGDSVGAAAVESLSRKHLAKLDAAEADDNDPDHPPPDYHNHYNTHLHSSSDAIYPRVIILDQMNESTNL